MYFISSVGCGGNKVLLWLSDDSFLQHQSVSLCCLWCKHSVSI